MHADIPAISGEAMAQIDRTMMEHLGVDTLQLMELAGWGIADAIRQHAGLDLRAHPVIICLAGTGGNGGDAMVVARLLRGWGAKTMVRLVKPAAEYSGVAKHQLEIAQRISVPVVDPEEAPTLVHADLVVDGLLGFSLQGNPRGESARLITLANEHPAPVVAIDLPSGLNATTGEVGDPCIRAAMTVTLALPKTGVMTGPAEVVGDLWLADIGVPSYVYGIVGCEVPDDLFTDAALVRIPREPDTGTMATVPQR